ncbi:MAG: serine/threonine-protein kinase [Polyangiaceae bacterium]
MLNGLLQPGRIVGTDFRVDRALSSGGMGAVYLAHQISTGKTRALKVMQPHILGSADARKRFAQEARVASKVDSEHVVEVIGAGIDGDTEMPWLAMELLEGEDLASYLAREPRASPRMTLHVFLELGHAVGAAHRANIVHRDLKPENIFLATSKRAGGAFVVKVLDFGIAKILSDTSAATTATIGSPMWMAPEQAQRGMAVSPATDVWALGMIAFRMLAGKPYWWAAAEADFAPMKVLSEMLLEPMAAASERARALGGAELPSGFDAWFRRAAAKEPSERFADATLAVDALQTCLGEGPLSPESDRERGRITSAGAAGDPWGHTEPVSTVGPSPVRSALVVPSGTTPTARGRGKTGWILGGALTLAAGVGGVAWYVSRQSTPTKRSDRRSSVTASASALSPPAPVAPLSASVEAPVVAPPIPSSSTGHFGGDGGGDLRLECPAGEVLRGLFGSGDAFFFQVGALCGIFTGWEQGRATFKRTTKVGPVGQYYSNTKEIELECPRDAALVTLNVGRVREGRSFMVGSVNLECAPIVRSKDTWQVSGTPFMTEEVKFDRPVVERARMHCEGGAALALIGRSGAWIDAVGLSWGGPSLGGPGGAARAAERDRRDRRAPPEGVITSGSDPPSVPSRVRSPSRRGSRRRCARWVGA